MANEDPLAEVLADLPTDLPNDIRSLCEAALRRMSKLTDDLTLELGAVPTPSAIYHYTSGEGLYNILMEQKLRLGSVFQMNDPAELRHGVSFANKALITAAEGGSRGLALFARKFSEFHTDGIEKVAELFVACFSSDRDELGQWRAYGDDGRGFAIGFDGVALDQAFMAAGMAPQTFQVRYDDQKLQGVQSALVTEVVQVIEKAMQEKLPNPQSVPLLRWLAMIMSLQAITASILFKHPAYKHEAEWRFLRMHRIDKTVKDPKFRLRRDTLVRYVEFDWRALGHAAIKEIIVGPATKGRVGETFAADCLRAAKFDASNIRITRSTIPYRGG